MADEFEGGANSVAPPSVTIYCQESSHESRRVELAIFDAVPINPADYRDRPPHWVKRNPYSRAKSVVDEQGALRKTKQELTTTMLRGDEPMDLRVHDEGEFVMRGREQVRFECRLCGLAKSERFEKLEAVLDRCAEHGVDELPLSVLVATLS